MGCVLTSDLIADCEDAFGVGGVYKRLIFINFDDVASKSVSTDGNDVKKLTDLTLDPGTRAYAIEAGIDSTTITSTKATNSGQHNFQQTVALSLPYLTAEAAAVVKQMVAGDYLVLAQTRTLNKAVGPVEKENRLIALGVYNGLSAGNTNGAAVTTAGPTQDIVSGTQVTLAGTELDLYVEVEPDTYVYGNTPIASFIEALLTAY